MVKTFLSVFLLALISFWGCSKPAEIVWQSAPLAELQERAGDAMIMLDFYTEW